jgi:hypothetical protein
VANNQGKKFEQLIHRFFGASCLEVDVFDTKGIQYSPREWFVSYKNEEVVRRAVLFR